MSQVTDRTVGANPTGFAMRTELNNIIAALESDNSGSSEPLNTVAYMKWLDTSDSTYYYYKERNHDNTAWVTLFRYTVATKIMEVVSNGVVLQDGALVHKTGNETIAGVKTLSDGLKLQGHNVSPFSGMKNYIINGNFDVWQYGTSQTLSGYGSADRWLNTNTGSTKTVSMQTTNKTEPFNSTKYIRTIVTSVVGVGNGCSTQQRIEGVNTLAGKTATLSFWAKADSNKNIAVDFVQYFGSGGTPSAIIEGISATKFAITSSWTKYTLTVNIPSIAGKSVGTDNNYSLWVRFWFDAGSNYNSTSANLGQQSGTFDIAQVQLEEGSVATPFEQRPYGLELSLCQRYCKNISVGAQSSLTVNCISFEPMRTAPSVQVVSYSGGTGATYAAATNDNFIYQTAAHSLNALAFLRLSAEL